MEKELLKKLADLVEEDISVSADNNRIHISYCCVSRFRADELDKSIDTMIEIVNQTNNYQDPKDDRQMSGRDNHIDYSRFVWIYKKEA